MPKLDYYTDSMSDDTTDTLGGRLSAARDTAGVSLEFLSRQMGVARQTLLAWESDRAEPGYARLTALARLLHVSPMWLMTGAGEGPDVGQDELQLRALKSELARLEAAQAENLRGMQAVQRQIAAIEARIQASEDGAQGG